MLWFSFVDFYCIWFIAASEKDLELEPRAPVTLKSSRLEDAYDVHDEIGK